MLTDHETTSILDTIIIEMAQSSSKAEGPWTVRPDMRITKDFGFDSLDFVDLISTVEEKFDIEVDDGIFESIETVDDLRRYVTTLKAAKARPHEL